MVHLKYHLHRLRVVRYLVIGLFRKTIIRENLELIELQIEIFNGYTRAELYVTPTYSTLMEEILESKFVSFREWTQHSHKAQCCVQATVIKNMSGIWSSETYERYGIPGGTPISFQHILSIILYCDTNNLQTHFTATFRKKHQFETINETKKRHSKYYHFAKSIVEAVHLYPIHENGPFYCGLNRVLHVGQYAIHLKGPTSTSVNIEVAISFAKRKGILMEMMNDGSREYMFDCSLISRYSEENERLFIGFEDMRRLRIASIRIVNTNKNHAMLCNSLYVLDVALSSTPDPKQLPCKKNIQIVSSLLSCKLNLDGIKEQDIDEYIWNCFNLYLLNKENIVIQMKHFSKYNIPFLFYDIRPTKSWTYSEEIDRSYDEYMDNYEGFKSLNLIHPNMLKLFHNVKLIDIVAGSNYKEMYEFDIYSLLLVIIESHKINVKYHIQAHRYTQYHGDQDTWLADCLTPSILSLCHDNGIRIRYQIDENGRLDHIWINE